MPEGHTIHRAALDQRRILLGQTVQVSSPQGRFMDGAAMIDGKTCASVEAYGKHLLYGFGNGLSLHTDVTVGDLSQNGFPVLKSHWQWVEECDAGQQMRKIKSNVSKPQKMNYRTIGLR